MVHVHLREKEIPINVGQGGQCVYWLAVTAVQRYVHNPDSYTYEYSGELTPKGILTQDQQWLDNRARIRDEIADGEHVWVDVGDGMPISDVTSRSFGQHTFEPGTPGDQRSVWLLTRLTGPRHGLARRGQIARALCKSRLLSPHDTGDARACRSLDWSLDKPCSHSFLRQCKSLLRNTWTGALTRKTVAGS